MSGDGDGNKIVRAVTTAQFAKTHGVTVFTVWRWIADGKVRAIKCPGGYRWRVIVEKSTEQSLADTSEGE